MQIFIPQLETLERGRQFSKAEFLYYNFFHSPIYGPLHMKFSDFNERHVFMNGLLEQIYLSFWKTMHVPAIDRGSLEETSHFKGLFLTESLVYWIRKNIDEIICLHFYVDHLTKTGAEPEKISIECIGDLIKKPKHDLYLLFVEHIPKLIRINNISNTYKHSFITSESHYVFNEQEPAVNCLELPQNHAGKEPVLHSHYLRYIIADYAAFFSFARESLKQFKAVDHLKPSAQNISPESS